MARNLLKQSPVVEGEEVKDSKLAGKFFKTADTEEAYNSKMKSYTYEIYIHILKEFKTEIILNGVQFSSDGNICFVENYSYSKIATDFHILKKITKKTYNGKVLLCSPAARKILAK